MSEAIQHMFARIAGRYDLANDALSGFQHRLWKNRMVVVATDGLTGPSNLLDLCCGTGDISVRLKSSAPEGSFVVGADFVGEMLQLAQSRSSADTLAQADALLLPFKTSSFDVVTVSFGIRNVDDVPLALKELYRVLRPGGKLVILEFGQPTYPGFRELYNLYSRYVMPVIGKLFTGDRAAYEYLPQTAKEFPAGARFTRLLEETGFSAVSAASLLSGIAYIYTGSRVRGADTAERTYIREARYGT